MRVVYKYKGSKVVKELDNNSNYKSILVADSYGSYFSQGIVQNYSFYQGFASKFHDINDLEKHHEWTLFKTIERIDLVNDNEIQEITITPHDTTIKSKKSKLTIASYHHNSLELYAKKGTEIILQLDPRKIYDFGTEGRTFSFEEKDGHLGMKYTKFSDTNCKNEEYSLFMAIKGYESYEIIDDWQEKNYDYDSSRSNQGKNWHVYSGIKLRFSENKIKLVHHFDPHKLEDLLFKDIEPKKELIPKLQKKNFENDEEYISYLLSIKSLSDLTIKDPFSDHIEGIYAGFYWFFQYWSRDEAISLAGAISESDDYIVNDLLKKQTSYILEDGRVPNRIPDAKLGSADGIGWIAKRISQFENKFSQKDKSNIYANLIKSCKSLKENYDFEGLCINAPKETWMDTVGSVPDTREGARIEIQALRLNLYDMIYKYTHNEDFRQYREDLRSKVREVFFKGHLLGDGATFNQESKTWITDETTRPNIFLAYYIYPKLLSKLEWEDVFEYAINKLWLDWGGLSTIEKDHPWFTENYTGENNTSYHRGDSWFFVNNIAAIAMHELNSHKFEKEITAIKNASIKERLEMGILGGSAEVSSASELRPEGTWQQAWSESTFIELLHVLKKN